MNAAEEHLEKHLKNAEDRKRRKQDLHFRRIEIGVAIYAACIATIALIVSVIALLK